jgi:hypothetical protein
MASLFASRRRPQRTARESQKERGASNGRLRWPITARHAQAPSINVRSSSRRLPTSKQSQNPRLLRIWMLFQAARRRSPLPGKSQFHLMNRQLSAPRPARAKAALWGGCISRLLLFIGAIPLLATYMVCWRPNLSRELLWHAIFRYPDVKPTWVAVHTSWRWVSSRPTRARCLCDGNAFAFSLPIWVVDHVVQLAVSEL